MGGGAVTGLDRQGKDFSLGPDKGSARLDALSSSHRQENFGTRGFIHQEVARAGMLAQACVTLSWLSDQSSLSKDRPTPLTP